MLAVEELVMLNSIIHAYNRLSSLLDRQTYFYQQSASLAGLGTVGNGSL